MKGESTTTTRTSELLEVKQNFLLYQKRVPGLTRINEHDWIAKCPFHPEDTPSFHVEYKMKNGRLQWKHHCYGCGADGSIIDYDMWRLKTDNFNVVYPPLLKEHNEGRKYTPPEPPKQKTFKLTKEDVQRFVHARHDTVGALETASFFEANPEIAEIAEELGLGYKAQQYFTCHRERCGTCGNYPAITIPIYTADGELIGMQYRNIKSPDGKHKWNREEGSTSDTLYCSHLSPVSDSEVLFFAEGFRDTALIRARGFNAVGYLSTGNTKNDKPGLRKAIEKLSQRYKHFVLVGDNDAEGIKARQKFAERCGTVDVFHAPPPPPHKDLNELREKDFMGTMAVDWWLKEIRIKTISPYRDVLRFPAVYPTWVWDGTHYGRFAEICGRENFIPREFFIESLKTLVGSMAGHLIRIEGDGNEARFYTVLIGPPQSGKGTSMDYVTKVFPASLFFARGKPIWSDLGCFSGSFASHVALVRKAKTHSHILEYDGEIIKLADRFRTPSIGLSYLSMVNDLYEKTMPPSNLTKECMIDVEQPVHFSILGAATPDKWEQAFGGTKQEGSGFFQRLNIIGSEETRIVPRLPEVDFTQFDDLVEKIKALRDNPYKLKLDAEADAFLKEWHDWIKTLRDVDTGRLNTLLLRNAAHLGWLLDVGRGGTVKPVEVLQRAALLSNWQVVMRQKYQPVEGDNPWAQMENAIKKYTKAIGRIKRSELQQKTHASRYGLKVFNNALEALEREEIVRIERAKTESAQGGRPSELIKWTGDTN